MGFDVFSNRPRRRQMFDWFCAGALAVIVPVEIIIVGDPRELWPGGFPDLYPASDSLGNFDNPVVTRPGAPDRPEKSHDQVGGLAASPARRPPDFSHPQAGDLAGAGRHAGGMDALSGHRLRYLVLSILLVIALILPLEASASLPALTRTFPQFTILHRLELYPFALHIWRIIPSWE